MQKGAALAYRPNSYTVIVDQETAEMFFINGKTCQHMHSTIAAGNSSQGRFSCFGLVKIKNIHCGCRCKDLNCTCVSRNIYKNSLVPCVKEISLGYLFQCQEVEEKIENMPVH